MTSALLRSVLGDTVELSLATAIQSGEMVSVSYTDPDESVDDADVIQSLDARMLRP